MFSLSLSPFSLIFVSVFFHAQSLVFCFYFFLKPVITQNILNKFHVCIIIHAQTT